jgi:uncharacterized protein YecT (DUF1311 family)
MTIIKFSPVLLLTLLSIQASARNDAESIFQMGYTGKGSKPPAYYYETAAEMGHEKAMGYALDLNLFRAEKSNLGKAKKLADYARKTGMKGITAESYRTIDLCFNAGEPSIPASDRPKKLIEDKECVLLKEDVNVYRDCVLSNPENNTSVAELYANGWGVKRNLTLALALVCSKSDVPMELIGMVEALSKETKPFLFCDYVTSGMNSGLCSSQRELLAQKKRESELEIMTKNWSAKEKELYQHLSKAAEVYIGLHASNEIDLTPMDRASMVVAEEASQRDELMNDVKRFERGETPREENLQGLDKELNVFYLALMKKDKIIEDTTIDSKGVRETQRSWITFRDAWVNFAKTKWPKIHSDHWKAFLTSKRLKVLKEISEV